jgi:hypothetical protein
MTDTPDTPEIAARKALLEANAALEAARAVVANKTAKWRLVDAADKALRLLRALGKGDTYEAMALSSALSAVNLEAALNGEFRS